MLTYRHCVILVLLAGLGCATATAGDDVGSLSVAGAGTGPITGAGGTSSDAGSGSLAFGGSAGVPAAAGRASGAAGRSSRFGSGGATSAAGSGSVLGGAGMASSVACPSPRMPAMAGAMQGNSGSFETTDAVCYFVEGTFNQWQCSNLGGRTITINGAPAMCGGALPDKADGGYYFEFSASTDGTNYTSFYWYTS